MDFIYLRNMMATLVTDVQIAQYVHFCKKKKEMYTMTDRIYCADDGTWVTYFQYAASGLFEQHAFLLLTKLESKKCKSVRIFITAFNT